MMKKLTLLLLLTMGIVALYAQQVPRQQVILEIATGTWCYYCPGAAMGADDLIANGHNVGVVEYHNGDPFANAASNWRNNYYNVNGYPTAHFDGVLKHEGGSHSQSLYTTYLPMFQQRAAIDSDFTISIHGENDGDDYTITLVLKEVNQQSASNLVAHLALTESEIPYSWQGQTELNFVERIMIPDHYGTDVDFSNTDEIILTLEFSMGNWVEEHCELVAFIQNDNTKEILQGNKKMLENLTPYVPPLSANFSVSDTTPCPGIQVQFFDESTGNPDTWAWSFPGGVPDTSNEESPVVYYESPGDFDVSLMVSTGFESRSTTKENFMQVEGTEAVFDPIDDQCIQYPPFELTQGSPAGGVYEGPGVVDGWFHPGEAGVGTHMLSYIYDDGVCVDTGFQSVYVDICENIADYKNARMNIYPNPSHGVFHVSMANVGVEDADLRVFDAMGKIVYKAHDIELWGNNEINLDLSNQPEGVYFIRLESSTINIYEKIVVRK